VGTAKQAWGWYPTGKIWVPLQVAATGKLVIDPTAIFENPPTNGETEKAPQSDWAYDHWKDPYAHQDTGGKCGVNVETLAGAKTLTPYADVIHQILNANGGDRSITLATVGAVAGNRFIIKNSDVYTSVAGLIIYQGGVMIDEITAGNIRSYVFDGTNWKGNDPATATSAEDGYNIGLGFRCRTNNGGYAMGTYARARSESMAIGVLTDANEYSVAIGQGATAYNASVALGKASLASGFYYSIALGRTSRTRRAGETAVNISTDSAQSYNYTQGRWMKETANDTPIEMFMTPFAGSRFTINAQSALAFQIKVVARDDIANEVAMYTFEGLIKRDAANNTVMSVCNKTIVHEDDATWDCNVTADDANEALIITVTGDATNPTQWAAVLEGVETHF